ncbi:hypothetical protein DM860_005455 [Cuscuta australis]|uniref:Uncharacterized protein n=1 Tax=Cuscuta australis TaxID=267555 RepID=A0A328E393_9ASTE|nr:hypothetical protein DM860_005895 [Cuscuta australis]RAL51099.1 hypothetical protein DM860_005455 [Cuscuta australis]
MERTPFEKKFESDFQTSRADFESHSEFECDFPYQTKTVRTNLEVKSDFKLDSLKRSQTLRADYEIESDCDKTQTLEAELEVSRADFSKDNDAEFQPQTTPSIQGNKCGSHIHTKTPPC